ncbi:LuxR C-terminal-related transcriptional regulator [Ilumatobacter nonamiensis]|uniref:LuxR C-terminal-related transcriptional regulator n=1 Tax=Ilumatobacter nonamiensis TaxID=467093 RepID=UPI00058E5C8D|nr:LuxR family transcriptional regulator [Ilumatobacter nonamiensis]
MRGATPEYDVDAPDARDAVPAQVPVPSGRRIHRVRLDHHFARAHGQLVRVLAPAGYGKTSLVARWVGGDERCVSWVDIARGGDDPVALLAHLRGALAQAVTIPEPNPAATPSANPYVEAVRSGLADTSTPFVLVLDDIHRLRSAATAWIVEALVEGLPSTSTVVLVGRSHNDHGSIGRLRLSPGVVDVTAADLVFDESETHRFLAETEIDAGRTGVRRTLELLDGWPAGLQLAATAIQRGVEPPDAADHATLVDYLRQEWLSSLDEDALEFLRQVALLEDFTATTCDQVLGRTGSHELIARLHRQDHVVFGLDHRGEWYRLHPVLRRWLAADLRGSDPERWYRVHRSAADYWSASDDVNRAVEHLRAVDDLSALEELVIAHGGAFLTRGLSKTVADWLTAFPPEVVRASPGLCSMQCLVALHDGDEARAMQWQRVLDDAVEARQGPPDAVTWWAMVLSVAIKPRPARELLPSAEAARTRLTSGPWAAFACWVHGGLAFVDGATDEARVALAAGEFEAQLTDNPMVRSNCLATAAVIDEVVGDIDSATERSRRSAELRRQCGGEMLPTAAIGLASAASMYARTGRRDEATRQLAVARTALAGISSIAPWFNILARIPLVRATLLLDDRHTSLELVHELEHHARIELPGAAEPTSDVLRHIAELRRQVDAMHRPASGAAALTAAELKVLQLLSTNLNLADIAKRLFVSRNTVKSHAASIYRKLGAQNRTQAVATAEAAGLLPTP